MDYIYLINILKIYFLLFAFGIEVYGVKRKRNTSYEIDENRCLVSRIKLNFKLFYRKVNLSN